MQRKKIGWLMQPKILIFDIETSYNVVYAFQLINDHPIPYQGILKERNIFTVAWQWLGEKKVHSLAVSPKSPHDDRQIVKKTLDLFHEADAVIAHYGDKFDMKYILTRAIFHGFKPPPPVKQIDTYKIAKQKFLFNCNRLDYIGRYLGVGGKIQTSHDLWMGCMNGDPKAIRKMQKYNEQDVRLLGRVYQKLAPFVPPKVNTAVLNGSFCCPGCGSNNLQGRGFNINRTGRSQRYQCKDCGLWSSSPLNKPEKIR